jgi:N-acetylmuramoyl-L-alanine amidase
LRKIGKESWKKGIKPLQGLVPMTNLTGFNWSKIPVVLVEMGYMTNPQEDIKLSTPEYQYKLAQGIVTGIEKYLASE